MAMKDEFKKVFNPDLVDSTAAKMKELNDSATSRKLKAAAKTTGRKLSNKLDELASTPAKIRPVRLSEDSKKSLRRGLNTFLAMMGIVFGIGVGLILAGFLSMWMKFILTP